MDLETTQIQGKSMNPFLTDDLSDYSIGSQDAYGGVNSNPFLSGADYDLPPSSVSDNPFLNMGNEDSSASVAVDGTFSASVSGTNTSTNPFADFSTDYNSTAGEDFFGASDNSALDLGDISTATSQVSSAGYNMFVTEDTSAPTSTAAANFFGNFTTDSVMAPSSNTQTIISEPVVTQQTAPDFLIDDLQTDGDFCKETADIFSNAVVVEERQTPVADTSSQVSTPTKSSGPRRPPPPRPVPPKETKDLILSVTGAMEATSSDLLDRLRATKTPSPTPIRELHSPSPTPDTPHPSFIQTDLLGEDSSEQTELSNPPLSSENFPDVVNQTFPATSSAGEVNLLGQNEGQGMEKASANDFFDIFGTGSAPSAGHQEVQPPATKQTSNADLLGLFGAEPEGPGAPPAPPSSAQPQPSNDLLFDFGAPATSEPESTQQVETNLFTSAPPPRPEPPPRPVPPIPVAPVSEMPPVTITGAGEMAPTSVSASTAGGGDEFDAFAAKFENVAKEEPQEIHVVEGDPFDPFGSTGVAPAADTGDVWGTTTNQGQAEKSVGFGGEDQFDAFLSLREPPPVPQSTPAKLTKEESAESDDSPDFSIFIKPKIGEENAQAQSAFEGPPPALAPPPKNDVNAAFTDSSPRFNPFDKSGETAAQAAPPGVEAALPQVEGQEPLQRTDSQETPPTPLFDEDVSQPLEEFPRINYTGEGWEMHLRQPNKKKITGQRFWKKVFVRLVFQGDNPVLQLFNTKDDKDPFQELPLQACYSVSEIGAQQFDAYGKIFTVKLQYVFYKERPGVRPGQVTKAERITNKISQFAAYAIQGDYAGVKEFGSDLRKLGLPVEHAPQISQLLKIGCQSFEDMKQFSVTIEEALFRLSAHRDRALNYKTEEVQITAVDEIHVEQDKEGHVLKQIARVRVFFLAFVTGMPDIELGVNDLVRQGKEVVGRHDIIPVITEEWIRLENVEFHSCVQQDEYEETRVIKFKPPDACYIELMRFRVRPPKNRELPLQLKAVMCIRGNKVEIKADILVPGFSSRKLGQIPCEDIMVRFPIPECWIYLFRVEKHFRYGSVKSSHRRTGKIKGIERLLGTMETLEHSLIEVSSGSAKYEHQHRAIVWRISRLPKEGQGAYTNHTFVCRLGLTSFDQVPETLDKYCFVEFTMPQTQVSHTTIRSVSVSSGNPPEKYVRYLARHEYRVEMEHTQGEGPAAYVAATITTPKPAEPEKIEENEAEKDSDSDSSS